MIRLLKKFPQQAQNLGKVRYSDIGYLKERETINTDVLIVGGGPAGLSAAIRLRQLAQQHNKDINVMLIEKGSEIGSHILSGAVIEPKAFDELFPQWPNQYQDDPLPLTTPAMTDKMYLLTEKRAYPLPKIRQMRNQGNIIASLSEITRWMGRRAEELGINLFPGFSGTEVLYEGERVAGVATNDVGLDRRGSPKTTFERGIAIKAKLTLFAEGCHGSLTKGLIRKFGLRKDSQHQTYGIGLKEVWEIPKEKHECGLVLHSVGWPLEPKTYGGSFMYHYGDNLVSLGLIVGLDYTNPYLNPYKEFQRLKTHPIFRKVLEDGKCIAYGARALNEGGLQSIPKLAFPGGALVGCAAGFVNIAKIKGSHTAMKSGMIAAECAFDALNEKGSAESSTMEAYERALQDSWIWKELWTVRNIRPAFQKFGLYGGLLYAGIDQLLFNGRLPWTFSHSVPDHAALKPASICKEIKYPKADGKLTFELLENVSRTGTNHEEDQPVHLQLQTPTIQVQTNLPHFAGPEQRFCPAGVYEYIDDDGDGKKFQINAQNCIHCKTCDIKDPSQNINWVAPEGGGGPKYTIT